MRNGKRNEVWRIHQRSMTMNKLEIIAHLALWGTIILQGLTIKDLRKQIEIEKQWHEYLSNAYLKERSRR